MEGMLEVALPRQSDALGLAGHRIVAHLCRLRLRFLYHLIKDSSKFVLISEIFPTCEKISIDYAVMEPAASDGKVFTYPADFGWSDLGNWQSLHEKLTKDADNNASVGNVHFYESSNCVVHAEDAKKVVIQGLDGYIVSEKGGQILICKRSEEQRIKDFGAK